MDLLAAWLLLFPAVPAASISASAQRATAHEVTLGPAAAGRDAEWVVEVDAPATAALIVWVEAAFDTRLVIESPGGGVLAEDDDSGGRPTPCVRLTAGSGPRLRLRAVAKDASSAGVVRFHTIELASPGADEEAAIRAAQAAIEALQGRAADPAATDGAEQARSAVAAFGERIASEAAAAALLELSRIAQQRGRLDVEARARRLLLAWRETILPPRHPDLQQARLDLAVVLGRGETLDEASALAEAALAILEETQDADAGILQVARDVTSVVRKVQGDLEGARELGELALAALTRTRPPDDELLLRVRSNAAVTRAMLGDLNGARELFLETIEILSATRGDDDSQLQVARMNLANAYSSLGDHAAAREIEESVLRTREALLPGHHPDVARSRSNLARTLRQMGDYEGARIQLERLLADQIANLPVGHPSIGATRESLALILRSLGDLEGARRIGEEVLAEAIARLPPDHTDLQVVRLNLAVTCMRSGEPARALELAEQAHDVLASKLPAQHPTRQGALVVLGNAYYALGRLPEALAVREEALEVAERSLPEGHAEILRSRHNLAITLSDLGEIGRALSLARSVVAGAVATLPEDHVDVLVYSAGLATMLQEIGDLEGARAIRERQLEIVTSTRPPHHPDVSAARLEMASTLRAQGDLEAAHALLRLVLESRLASRSPGHPEVFEARVNLAGNRLLAGDAPAALELLETALADAEAQIPAAHPSREVALHQLAQGLRVVGEHERARACEDRVLAQRRARLAPGHPALQRSLLAVARGAVLDEVARRNAGGAADPDPASAERFASAARDFASGGLVAARTVLEAATPREASERGAGLAPDIGMALQLAQGAEVFAPDGELGMIAFEFSETVRSAALASARRMRASGRDPRDGALQLAIRRASRQLADLAASGAPQSELDRVRGERERAEQTLLARVRAREQRGEAAPPPGMPPAAELARALGSEGLIAAFRVHGTPRLTHAEERGEPRLHAHVLTGDGTLRSLDLGPEAQIREAAVAWTASVVTGVVPARGLARPGASAAPSDPDVHGARLRELVLDPVLAAAPKARRIVLLLDGPLHRVAWDALPLRPRADGTQERSGDRFDFELATSLAAWSAPAVRATGSDRLVAIGAIDYSAEAGAQDAVEHSVRNSGVRSALVTRAFAPLPGSRAEVEAIAALHARQGEDRVLVLAGGQATSERFLGEAESARWLHVATHGWFAPELFGTAREQEALDEHSGLGARLDRSAAIRERSPLLLCGLAFAGANRSVGIAGERHGLVTAEEIAALDLRSVELAVLSACETHLGVEDEGQGVASLQQALLLAGAQAVITSLFEVPDEATSELMQGLYERLWSQGESPARALWGAKLALRWPRGRGETEAPLAHWAGWVTTGNAR